MNPWADQRLRFLLVGGFNTVFGYLIFAIAYLSLRHLLALTVILVVSYVIAVPVSYITQRVLVFRSKSPYGHEIARFVAGSSVIFFANLICLPIAQALVPAGPLLIQAAFVGVSVIGSYVVHKRFSFLK